MEKVKLADIAEFIRTGKTPPTSQNKYFDGEVNWYTPGDFRNGKNLSKSKRTLTELSFIEKKAVVFPKNTLLITCIGDIGKLGITYEESSSNQQITGLKPNKNVDVDYLYYWFLLNKKKIESTANNAVVAILNNKTLQNIEFEYPPLPTQQKIAEILDKADELRQYNKQLIAKYEALTQSLFLEMFGDPVRNEKGWEVKSLGEILDFLTSGSRGWAKYYSDRGDIFLRIQNVGYNKLRLDDLCFVATPESAEAKRTKVKTGDIVLSITADLGRTAVIPENFPTAFINQHLAILRLSEDNNPNYVSAFIATNGGQTLFNKMDKGGVKAGLNFTDLRSYQLFVPPIALQNQFAERVQMIESQKQQAQEALEKSEQLFQGLLQKVFKGELV